MRIPIAPGLDLVVLTTDTWFPAHDVATDECSRCARRIADGCVPLMLWNTRGDMLRFHPCCIGLEPCCIDALVDEDAIHGP